MHAEVRKFVEGFESKTERNGRAVKLNEIEIIFLENVYGPEFAFNFQGLSAQLPFKDYKGGNRFIDFYYENGDVRILIEIDGYRYHVEGITAQQYDDHQERQNDLMLAGGWTLVRFTANMILKKPMLCRRQLVQAVGKSLILANRTTSYADEAQRWLHRKNEIVRLLGHYDILKPSVLSKRYGITRKTAAKWLRKMSDEGDLLPVRPKKLIVGYTAPGAYEPGPETWRPRLKRP